MHNRNLTRKFKCLGHECSCSSKVGAFSLANLLRCLRFPLIMFLLLGHDAHRKKGDHARKNLKNSNEENVEHLQCAGNEQFLKCNRGENRL